MTTPEQIQKWREEFEAFYSDEPALVTRDRIYGNDYTNDDVDAAWRGYLRRCRETEQAIKAVFEAMSDVDISANDTPLAALNRINKIKELLK